MGYSKEFINTVKAQIDLRQLASEYTKLEKVGHNVYQGCCPSKNHKDDSPSFTVYTDTNTWCCFGCHNDKKNCDDNNIDIKNAIYGTDCFAFYQWIKANNDDEYVPWYKAVEVLCDKFQIPIVKQNSKDEALIRRRELLTQCYVLNLYDYPKRYLYERGLSDNDIKKWRIGYLNGRIVFPLFNKFGTVLGYSKRLIEYNKDGVDEKGKKLKKYINSCNSNVFNKSTYFFGSHNIEKNFDEIRIVEGVMDVIVPHKYGAKNIVATLGTSLTEKHIEIIKTSGKTPVLVLDGDDKGKAAATRHIEKLFRAGLYPKILLLPDGMDLCDKAIIEKDNIENYITMNSFTYGQFKTNTILKEYQVKQNELDLSYLGNSNEIKIKYYKKALEIIEAIPDDIEKAIIKNSIESITSKPRRNNEQLFL